ncbi:MAG: glycosyltransferase family protein [Candidatus Helarchaeota archaeon]
MINEIFKKYPEAAACFVGVVDYDGKRRFWEWNDCSGFNLDCPDAVVFNENFSKELIKLSNVQDYPYAFREYIHRIVLNYPVVVLHEPLVKIEKRPKYEVRSWRKYLNFFKKNDWNNKEIIEVYPRKKILIVGYFNQECKWIADEFFRLGWDVTGYKTDIEQVPSYDYPILNFSGTKNELFENLRGSRPFKMLDLIEELKPDYILHVQNDMILDYKGVYEPLIFYAHRGLYPRLPRGIKPVKFFYPYFGAVSQYKNAHPYEMSNVGSESCKFIPYAWSPIEFPAFYGERPTFFGFMGSEGGFPIDGDVDFWAEHLREDRNRYIRFAKKNLDLVVKASGSREEYWDFMAHTNLALNVGPNFGGFNQRMFHAMGIGCVLVQNYFEGIETLGFKDRVNCLLFKDEGELTEKIEWAKDHPKLLEKIRQTGRELAQKHTYEKRVKQMAMVMIRDVY